MWDSKTNFWYLGISTFATVCFAGYLNYKINQWLDKRRKNHLLGFGPSVQQCDGHMNREYDCGNLDCNYGRLRHPTRQFVIVDNEVFINGSMDFTMTGAFCNWENVMRTTQPVLVDAFQNIFDKLWDDCAPVNYSNNDSHVNV